MSAYNQAITIILSTGMDVVEAGALLARVAMELMPKVIKASGAERTRRWREKKQASPSVTVTSPTSPLPPPVGDAVTSQSVTVTSHEKTPLSLIKEKKERGNRLPCDWKPSEADWALVLSLLGKKSSEQELAKFRDHWKAQPGSKGIKLDWDATWRNWGRREASIRTRYQPKQQHNIMAGLS